MNYKSQLHNVIPDEIHEDLVSKFFWNQLDLHRDKVLFVEASTGKQYTGEQIKKLAVKVAHYLLGLGFREGQVCLSFCNSTVQLIYAIGVLFAGGTFCSGYDKDPEHEHKYMYQQVKPAVVVCHKELEDSLESIIDAKLTSKLCVIDDEFNDEIRGQNGNELFYLDEKAGIRKPLPVRVKSDQAAFILFTSGSTGNPKPVNRSQRNSLYVAHSLNQARVQEQVWYLDENSVMAGHLPLDHGTGTFSLKMCLAKGYKLVLIQEYDHFALLKAIDEFRITDVMFGAGLIHNLISLPSEVMGKYNISSLVNIISVGSPIPSYEKVIEFMDLHRHVSIRQSYGMTECGFISIVPRQLAREGAKAGVGRLLPNFEIKIDTAEPAQPGILHVKGETVSRGYLGNKFECESSRRFNSKDGYYMSSDLALMSKLNGQSDDEILMITGRSADVLCLNDGWKVLPYEIEAILLKHPKVLEAAVTGVPNPEIPGQHRVRAYVTPRKRDDLPTPEEIKQFASERLSGPKHLKGGVKVLLDELPKISVGKVDKRQLRRMDGLPDDLNDFTTPIDSSKYQ